MYLNWADATYLFTVREIQFMMNHVSNFREAKKINLHEN